MIQRLSQYTPGPRSLCAALAITALAAIGSPGTASASTTAGSSIINIVQVDYKDVTGTNAFKAAYSTTVVINLVKAPLSIITPPSAANYNPSFSCLANGSFASGGDFAALYALTAMANGQDNYNLSISNASNNASSSDATYTILNADGTVKTAATNAASIKVLNSAIVVGTTGTDTLRFPGGSLKATVDGGFVLGDIVVVDDASGKTAYLVLSVHHGVAKTYSINATLTPGPSSISGALGAEDQDTIKLGAYTNNSYGIGNGNVAPAFTATVPAVGTVAGQMVLVKIDVTAVSNVKDTNATVDYKLTTTDGSGANTMYVGSATNTPPNTCNGGNFLATKLTILKTVTNQTHPLMAAGTGDPGDILDYAVTVYNAGGQAAEAVVIDNIPPYTKLVTYSGVWPTDAQSNTTAGTFAAITDGANTVNLHADGSVDAQPASPNPTVGYGTANGYIAGSALRFTLGQGSTSALGGTVPSCNDKTKNTEAACTGGSANFLRTYTIRYSVRVD